MERQRHLLENVLVISKSTNVRLLLNGQAGISLLETIVALAILGVVALALLSGLATGVTATSVTEERAIAESLLRSQIEYVESRAYVSYPAQYTINPLLNIPTGWAIPTPTTSLVHATDDGLQKVAVSAIHNGETVLTISIYKVRRS